MAEHIYTTGIDYAALSMPAELLIPDLPANIHDIALKHGTFESLLRIHENLDTYTLTENANASSTEKEVPVRPLMVLTADEHSTRTRPAGLSSGWTGEKPESQQKASN